MRPYKTAKELAAKPPPIYRVVASLPVTKEQQALEFKSKQKAIVDSYQIWNKILSYLQPNKKQQLALLNKDLNTRTKDYMEWELRDVGQKKQVMRKPVEITEDMP
jgi:hypothetical protein